MTKTKKKKSQTGLGIILLIAIIMIGIILFYSSNQLGIFWITGICFGFILQKSRFCFTAAIRDPFLTGNTSLTKALLIAFAITTIGFTVIKFNAYTNGVPIPGQSFIVPISLATVIGAFMFGIGMVISGGCACGTLMRTGEGFTMQIITLVFFIVGSLWGAHDLGWWEENIISQGKAIFLPDIFGWFSSLALQLLLIFALYILAKIWGNKMNNS